MSQGGAIYWVFVVALLSFGAVSIFSIGAPFVLLGLTLLVVAPWRGRPAIVWPAVVGVMGLVVGYVLVAPLACTATSVARPGDGSAPSKGRTRCASILSIEYEGTADYESNLLPALAVGVTAGATSYAATASILRRRERASPSRGSDR